MFGALFRPERKNARAMRGEGEEKVKMKKGMKLTFPPPRVQPSCRAGGADVRRMSSMSADCWPSSASMFS